MLTLKYKTTKDFPGTPAGTVLTRDALGNYRDEATKFWMHQSMVENTPDFMLHEVSDGNVLKFSSVEDVAVKATQELTAAITAVQAKIATVQTEIAVKPI